MINNNPIGVFDSGIGGITVVKAIMNKLPHENIVYFGDIARLPYGTKSVATIRKFAGETVQFLINQQVKAIVIACNTISAVAQDEVRELASLIPVIDVISSGSKDSTQNGNKIGIIATPATINSNAYPNAIKKLKPQAEVFAQACSLFVPLIEEGFIKHKALEIIAQEYLNHLKQQNIDTLVLGCTHYPLIKATLQQVIGSKVNLIDPANSTCDELIRILSTNNWLNQQTTPGNYQFFVTEITPKFQQIGERFLHKPIEKLELINLDS